MAGLEDTELRDLVVEALEKNGSLANIRAMLRANIFLAFENEHEPQHNNPMLDRLLASPEGSLALEIVAEFLDFLNLHNTAYVYKAESRQGHAYRYEGRSNLPEYLVKKYSGKSEPMLVTILKSTISNHRKKNNSVSPNKEGRKEDDNCTYIVHEDSGSARSHSDNSSDDKNKLLLRLPLDNSDTDTSSDSLRDKTSSEYIPNQNIQLDPDSEDESKELHYILSPKSYIEETKNNFSTHRNHYDPQVTVQNSTYSADIHQNLINSSESTSYLELKPNTLLLKISNGNTDTVDCSNPSLADASNKIEISSQAHKTLAHKQHLSAESPKKSNVGVTCNKFMRSQEINQISPEQQSDKTCNYSDDFSPFQESSKTTSKQVNKNVSPRSTDSSIQEEITVNGSDQQGSNESPGRHESSRSSISLSDVAELIENSASSPSSYSRKISPKSTFGKNPSIDEVAQRLTNLFRKDEENRMSSTKNSSEEISDSPIQSLSNISIEVHSE